MLQVLKLQVWNKSIIVQLYNLLFFRSIFIYARISWEITKKILNYIRLFLRRYASVQRNYNYRPINPFNTFTSPLPQTPSAVKKNFDEKTTCTTETEIKTIDDDYMVMENSPKSPNNTPAYSSVKKGGEGGLREESMPLMVQV